MVTHRLPGQAVQLCLSDVTKMPHCGKGNVGQRDRHKLTGTRNASMALSGQQTERDLLTGDDVPCRERVVGWLGAITGKVRQTHFTVHGVIKRVAPVSIASEINEYQILAVGAKRFVTKPAPCREISHKKASILAGSGNQLDQQFATFWVSKIYGNRAFAFVE